MKKSTRLSIRVLSLLMTLLMIFSFSATVFAMNVEIEGAKTKYYDVTYNSDVAIPEFTMTMDAEALGKFLDDRNFTKAELLEFLPEVFANAIENGTFPNIKDIVAMFPNTSDPSTDMVSRAEVTKFIPVEVYDKYEMSGTLLREEPEKFIKNFTDMIYNLFLEHIEYFNVTSYSNGKTVKETVYFSDDTVWEMHFNELIAVILSSLPTVETLENAKSGDQIWAVEFEVKYRQWTDATKALFQIKFDGDTSTVNEYAEKIANLVNYEVINNNVFSVVIDDTDPNSPVSFAGVLNTALNSDKLTAAEKAEIFALFNKKGDDLVAALKAFDMDNASIWLDDKYIPTLTKLRDKALVLVEKLMDVAPGYYAQVSLADIYNAQTNSFLLEDSLSVETNKVLDKIFSVINEDSTRFQSYFDYDAYVTLNLSIALKMKDIYRVRYFDVDGTLLYTTFLPVGANLSIISDNTAEVAGKAQDGWKDDNANVPTVMPAEDLDLYAAKAKKTYTVTFIADNKVVDRVTYTEGDTKLSRVPQIPFKNGYLAKWENYQLADKDIVVRAIYTAKTYIVTFDANGGEGEMERQILAIDVMKPLNANKYTRAGYTFAGWNTKADGTGYTYADKELVRNLTYLNGVTLYAVWEEIPAATHTVTFMANGEVVDKVTFTEGDKTLSRVPNVPAREGYNGSWTAYTLGTSDITVNAVYTAKAYFVSFDANGGAGETMDPQTMNYDELVKLHANTYTYEGYKFVGWNTKADGTGVAYEDEATVKNLTAEGNVVLYAQWEEVEEETTTADTTTPAETTTTEEPEEGGFNWLILILILAILAIIAGVVAYLIHNKKKNA
ncbi:MAG: InlB B-repeat-containing protein [Clostridia bacterium]|nr:InlB B-repeat-containing protein [Clostridia bacterium]